MSDGHILMALTLIAQLTSACDIGQTGLPVESGPGTAPQGKIVAANRSVELTSTHLLSETARPMRTAVGGLLLGIYIPNYTRSPLCSIML